MGRVKYKGSDEKMKDGEREREGGRERERESEREGETRPSVTPDCVPEIVPGRPLHYQLSVAVGIKSSPKPHNVNMINMISHTHIQLLMFDLTLFHVSLTIKYDYNLFSCLIAGLFYMCEQSDIFESFSLTKIHI